MGEKGFGDGLVEIVKVVEAEHSVFRQAVHHAKQVRDHHAQPGAPALAEGHHDDVGALQFVELLDAAQLAFGGENLCLRLAAHLPVQNAARQFLAAGLPQLADILDRQVHACCPP